MTSFVSITDLFCGAGGSSWGAEKAGGQVQLALNHWQRAIETHAANFPRADHECTDISAVNPLRFRPSTILIASPECTNHSLAKGQKRKLQAQMELFGKVALDPSEERSRATMWDVPRFAEHHDYEIVIVENVVDARRWRPFEAWLSAMHLLGYDHEIVYLNSMFAHLRPAANPAPDEFAPQSRDRMYVVFWKHKNKRPNLDFRPLAFCPRCERDVEAVQSWKKGHKTGGVYGERRQYTYCCPTCAQPVKPYYYAAANAIDWSNVGERIGDRKRPLKERTVERIRLGLEKFGRQAIGMVVPLGFSQNTPRNMIEDTMPTQTCWQDMAGVFCRGFVVPLAYSHGHNNRAVGSDSPMPTQTTRQDMGLAIPPFLVQYYSRDDAQSPISDAVPTVTTEPRHALVMPEPFLSVQYTPGYNLPVGEPMGTVTTNDHHALVTPPPFIVNMRNHAVPDRVDQDPMTTVVAGGNHHYLVMPEPFLMSYYSNSGYQSAVSGVVPTVTALDRHALVQPSLEVEDCYFRMLQPTEIGRAMGFHPEYEVKGTSKEKVKQYGNAVTPIAMRRLVERCIDTLQ